MAATDGQIIVAAARWSDEGSYLREFIHKHPLPAVVKIIKGQYTNLGVPSLPSPGLQPTALLASAGRRQKLLAQPVKIKEGRRLVPVGPRLLIPASYPGYFELLSEEGRAVRCVESVAELARRHEPCLVRETLRAVAARLEADALHPEGARTLPPGALLTPAGEAHLPGARGRYLKLRDANGDLLLLGLEQRGKFSVLAREDNISGVHTARNLLSKRLPLTVRLVHGTPPLGLKNAAHFVPELRLLSVLDEEHVFALPLQKEAHHLTPLPLAAPLKLLRTRNEEQLRLLPEFARLAERATRLIADVADRMQALDGKLGDAKKQLVGGHQLQRSASSESAMSRTAKHRIVGQSKNYDEIDQIYDYVRGFAPLPKPARVEATRPEPPPIETIPTKKAQAEKRNRSVRTPPGLPKLYVKNGQKAGKGAGVRQKSASPMKEAPPSPVSKAGSPLFNIRYKSLSNLQGMELDGTLDSSNSGGRGSGESGGGAKQPEKRSRRISRPRSLTNLVWEAQQVGGKKGEYKKAHGGGSGHKFTVNGHRCGTLYL